MRLLFAGTPGVALPSLEALAARHEVVAVLTRPDARSGRGRRWTASPVKEWAESHVVPVLQPTRPGDIAAELADLDLDAAAVVAYGALLPAAVLDIPRHGWINLHFSVLPAWRGAAPVQHAIIAGDEVSGATTFRITEGLDTGPVYGTLTETIRSRDTAGDLLDRLAAAGADLFVATLDAVATGEVRPVEQPAEGISHAPRLTRADAEVRWNRPAHVVDRLVRGSTPEPGAWTTLPDGSRLGLGPVAPIGAGEREPTDSESAGVRLAPGGGQPAPGEVVVTDGVVVGCAPGMVRLGEVTPQGRRTMAAADWARGARLEPGTRLGARNEL